MERLRLLTVDDDYPDFFCRLRMHLEWDQPQLEEILQLLEQALVVYSRGEHPFPKWLMRWIRRTPSHIRVLMNHPLLEFVVNHDDSHPIDARRQAEETLSRLERIAEDLLATNNRPYKKTEPAPIDDD